VPTLAITLPMIVSSITLHATRSPTDAYLDKYNDSTKQIDQTVSVNGKVVSTLSTTSGVGAGWGTGMLSHLQTTEHLSSISWEDPNH